MLIISLLWAGAALFTSVELARYVVQSGNAPEPEPEPTPPPKQEAVVVVPPAPEDAIERVEASLGWSVGALRRAHVSISMIGATDVAIDTAQIVLESGSLQQLDTLFELATSFGRSHRTIIGAARSVTVVGGMAMMFLGLGLPGVVVLYVAGVGLTYFSATRPLRGALRIPSAPHRVLIGAPSHTTTSSSTT